MKKLFTIILLFLVIKTYGQCPWSITNPVATFSFDCGTTNAGLNIAITGPTVSLKYLYTSYPPFTSFNPGAAIAGGSSSPFVSVNKPGTYVYNVTNTVTNCTQSGTINLVMAQFANHIGVVSPASCSACCDGQVQLANLSQIIFPFIQVTSTSGIPSNQNVSSLCTGSVIICIADTIHNCHRCDTVHIGIDTGLEENRLADGLIFYPNPTNSVFYLKNINQKSGTIKILNIEGRVMETLILESEMETKIENLKAGIYFAEMRFYNSIIRKKLIVLN